MTESVAEQIMPASNLTVIVGHSIEAITTATVMVTLGHSVRLYCDMQALQHTLSTYTFEYQQQALWQLYLSEGKISVQSIPDKPIELYSDIQADLLWFFYNDLPEQWQDDAEVEKAWVRELNASQLNSQIPLILSGTSPIGVFSGIAKQCKRPWVFYIPFVFMQGSQSYPSMLSPKLWLMGEKTENSIDKIVMLQPLIAQASQRYTTDIATVEFSRSAIMSMLATRVSFMNEWSKLADALGINITEVSNIMGLDSRIGKSYLKAGWGFGGKTLPTEISALNDTLDNNRINNLLMKAVSQINNDQKELIFRKFWQYFDGTIENKVVAIWGASYKAGSGRTSSSAIHPLLRLLWSYNIKTYVYANESKKELKKIYFEEPLLEFISNPIEKLKIIDALFIIAWPDTLRLPISSINEAVVPVFDAQNIFDEFQINTLVGYYEGIGQIKKTS